MLAQLTIRNFALVDSATLEFQRGFNVLTGETGAGKSILIDAINAALGERAGAELVRQGADRASIEAVFDVSDCPLPLVQEWAEEGVIILAREISASGRSVFRMNGRMCTASTMREVAADLIDIHGQHDHQSLLRPERHVDFLDAWAGRDVLTLKRRAQELHGQLRQARKELAGLLTDERDRARRLDLLRFQLEEIDSAKLTAGEEEELLADRTRLANAEKLLAAASAGRESLDAGEVTALDLLASAAREIDTLATLDERCASLSELIETAIAAARDAAGELRSYAEDVEFNPERLEQVQERLELIRNLKRKYGDTIPEILAFGEEAAAGLDALTHGEERREALIAQAQQLARQTAEAAAALFRERSRAATSFEKQIAEHLNDLNMAGTRFAVQLQPPATAEVLQAGDAERESEESERSTATVLGRAELVISANPGEPLRPLARIASGGEMSRVMLALKTALAGSHPVALIFDEIDTGVGGKTADTLGLKMAELSRSNQVLCVTHLSQIASQANQHFQVRKEVTSGRTLVEVTALEGEARVGELARMLGGSETTAAQHARELLATASAARGAAGR